MRYRDYEIQPKTETLEGGKKITIGLVGRPLIGHPIKCDTDSAGITEFRFEKVYEEGRERDVRKMVSDLTARIDEQYEAFKDAGGDVDYLTEAPSE